jgi:MtrB/PioB family decaheme-associated outer membrane protein
MNRRQPRNWRRTALSLAVAAVTLPTVAQEADPFAALAAETRPWQTQWQTDYRGSARLGAAYTSDDSFMFGQYNGLHEKGATLIGDLQWQSFGSADSWWRVSAQDLGLETREGEVTWGMADRLRLTLAFDSQLQVRNDSGRTPFSGGSGLVLPADWTGGIRPADWPGLEAALQGFDRELERDTFSLSLAGRLNEDWDLRASLSREERKGTTETGAAIYSDAAGAQAVLLPAPVDYTTTEFDIGVGFKGDALHLDGTLFYSDFDNDDALLTWANPYTGLAPAADYPNGSGGLGLAPDNQLWGVRGTGVYILTPTARLQVDGSYTRNEQDQAFSAYTVNNNLIVSEPLPRDDLGGEVDNAIFNAKLLLRPLPRLNLELRYRGQDRDYSAPRDGYRYPRGDASDQPGQALAVYNRRYGFVSNTYGIEGNYPLPLRSRLYLEYEYEEIERENSAVEETSEDRYRLRYRIQPWSVASANLELQYGDRAAGTYQWDQSYYSLLDTELINATPANQRYLNHPALSQYHLANRERSEAKLDLDYRPTARWQLTLNLLWRDDDYDRSELGLTGAEWQRANLGATWMPATDISVTAWLAWDNYESEQSSRAFRGGQEKNAFDIYPPLPQASDPSRNWDLEHENRSTSAGLSGQWQISERLSLEAEYSYVDTSTEQAIRTGGAADLVDSVLPEVDTTQHQISASGIWHLSQALSLQLDYQYFRCSGDDWAWAGLQPDTLDRVLTTGERNPNETVHYMGVSAIYRWQ